MATKTTRVRVYGGADRVIELFDDWEAMGIISVRIGTQDYDEEGGVKWETEEHAMEADTAQAFGEALVEMAVKLRGQP